MTLTRISSFSGPTQTVSPALWGNITWPKFSTKHEVYRDVLLMIILQCESQIDCDSHESYGKRASGFIATIYICTLLAWAKCFLATYGEYPGLYDLLDTPRSVFIAAQLHLRDSTFPRPLLP